jgi:tetratricopeptide (TPR) repeat protein
LLARAYVRERRFPPAFAAFDTLLAAGATVPLLREAAGAHATARDSIGNAMLLRRAVGLAPYDVTLRRDYAGALAWSGDRPAAIAEYTALLRASPNDPDLLFRRGQLYAWSRNYPAAERDLAASLARRPSSATYALLGDVYRWSGDERRARQAYAAALALTPGDSTSLAGLLALDHAGSSVVASGIAVDDGWVAQFTHSEDNAGFLYLAGGIARGFEIGRGTIVGVGAEQRRIGARSSRAPERHVYGFALSARAAHQFGPASAGLIAGIARHGMVPDIPFGEFRLATRVQRTSLDASVSRGPVYLPLVSAQSLIQFNGDGVVSTTPLIGRSAHLGGSLPIGAITVTASGDVTSLSDGNRRTSGYLGAAYPIAPQLSLLYSGFALGYSARSSRYWDPTLYDSHSVGVQYALQNRGPLSLTARVLSGVGRATEIFPTRDGPSIRSTGRAALQLAGSGELAYRSRAWELAATAGYARGREGEYQSLNSSLRLRLMP